jgi:DNA-binding IclR family transcriptional regulator
MLSDADAAKQQGYAVSMGERIKGSASVAVPVRDILNNVVASLSISTLEDRLTPDTCDKFLELLLDASRQIHETYVVTRGP